MCGIVGFVDNSICPEKGKRIINAMHNSMNYRGPDDSGSWIHDAVYLGHRRLSIIDISSAGHQPMVSSSGRFIIVFNGEIYNHEFLRQIVSNSNWIGDSDTETLLACVEKIGIEKTLEVANGMFAFALWDKLQMKLYLARDKAGEKPLYYGQQNNLFLFGSELAPFILHPSFKREINPDALEAYIRKGFVPAPFSIFKGVKKLIPGTYLIVNFEDYKCSKIDEHVYWSIENNVSNRFVYDKGLDCAIEDLDDILQRAVSSQLISDVPIGAFLSGGIDSSLIVSLMQKVSSHSVKTFTIGFNEDSFNEAKYAKEIAKYLGTTHTELYISDVDALNVVPTLANVYSEPFADVSQIPTILVSKLARSTVKVALSGDGGDELFCGYGRYLQADKSWNRLSKVPYSIRQIVGKSNLHPFCEGVKAKTIDEFYHFMNMQWKGHKTIVRDANCFVNRINTTLTSSLERMMLYDFLEYLPDDILVKVDRASMSQSLETRVPFLDKEVIDFAWKLPISYKLNNGTNKWPLKKLLLKYLPIELIDRPKMGFGVPLDNWLRNSLKEWANELLSVDNLEKHGLFDSTLINENWNDYIKGGHNRSAGLWTILMFQDWYEKLNDFRPVQ